MFRKSLGVSPARYMAERSADIEHRSSIFEELLWKTCETLRDWMPHAIGPQPMTETRAMTASAMSDIQLIPCSGRTLHFTAVPQDFCTRPVYKNRAAFNRGVRTALLMLHPGDLGAAGVQLLLA